MTDTVFEDSDKTDILFKRFMGVSCTKVEQPFTTESINAFNPVLSSHIWYESDDIPIDPPQNPINYDILGILTNLGEHTRIIQYYDELELEIVSAGNNKAWRDPLFRNFLSRNADEDISNIKQENIQLELFNDKLLNNSSKKKFTTKNITEIVGVHIAKIGESTVDYPFNFTVLFNNRSDILDTYINKANDIYTNLTGITNTNYSTNRSQFDTDIATLNTNDMLIQKKGPNTFFSNTEDIFTVNTINANGPNLISNILINIIDFSGSLNTFNTEDADISFAYNSQYAFNHIGWTHISNVTELSIDDNYRYIKIYKYLGDQLEDYPNNATNFIIFENINDNAEFDIISNIEPDDKIILKQGNIRIEFLNTLVNIGELKDIYSATADDFSFATIIKLKVLIDEYVTEGYITNKIEGNRLKNILYYPYNKIYGSRVTLIADDGGSLPQGDITGGDWIIDPSTGILTFHSYDNINTRVNENKKPKISFFRYIGKTGLGGSLLDTDSLSNRVNIQGSAIIADGMQVNKETVLKGDVRIRNFDDTFDIFNYSSTEGTIFLGSDEHDNGPLSDYPEIGNGNFILDLSGNIRGDNAEFIDTIHAREIITWSDRNLKENICQMELNIDNVSKMRGVHFVWKDTGKEDIGFIAQEVEEIIPQIVHNTRSGYKAISYEKMIPILLEYIKHVDDRVKYLEKILQNRG